MLLGGQSGIEKSLGKSPKVTWIPQKGLIPSKGQNPNQCP